MARFGGFANILHLVSVTSDLRTPSEMLHFVTVTDSLLIMRTTYRDTVMEHMEKVMGMYSPPMVTDIQGTLDTDTQ